MSERLTSTLEVRSAAGVDELALYGPLGEDLFTPGGISALAFRSAVKQCRGRVLNLRINSPGGSVIEANAMVSCLDEWRGKGKRVEVDIDGLAASAASYLACTGDVTRMAQNSLLMIHDPYAAVVGGADEMRRLADLLDKVKTQIIATYQRKTKLPSADIAEMMSNETWLTATEAVEHGFADSYGAPTRMAASADWSEFLQKFGYKKVPPLHAGGKEPRLTCTEREALRRQRRLDRQHTPAAPPSRDRDPEMARRREVVDELGIQIIRDMLDTPRGVRMLAGQEAAHGVTAARLRGPGTVGGLVIDPDAADGHFGLAKVNLSAFTAAEQLLILVAGQTGMDLVDGQYRRLDPLGSRFGAFALDGDLQMAGRILGRAVTTKDPDWLQAHDAAFGLLRNDGAFWAATHALTAQRILSVVEFSDLYWAHY